MPVCADPKAVKVPAPEACWLCSGAGGDCGRCHGGKHEHARFDLAPSRTHQLRRVRFEVGPAGVHTMRVWMLRSKEGWKVWPAETVYRVTEFPCDFKGRAFCLEKIGTNRKHELFIGHDGSAACHCEGETYQSATKADQKAYERGDRVYRSKGCLHLDALSLLVSAGWLDCAR